MVTAEGTVAGVAFTELEAAPAPSAFKALTVQAYSMPFVRPATRIGLTDPLALCALPEDAGVHTAR